MRDQTSCSVCGARVHDGTTTYAQEIRGQLAIVTEVPVQACPQCGEQHFSPATVDRLQRLLTQADAPDTALRTIQVPVYPFS